MFYVVQPLGPDSSQRARELENSRTRAHAASVAHKRRTRISKTSPSRASSTRMRRHNVQAVLSEVPCQSNQQDANCALIRDECVAPSLITSPDGRYRDCLNPIPHENQPDSIRQQPSMSSIPRDRFGNSFHPFMCMIGGRSYDISMAVDFYTKITIPTIAPLMEIFNITNSYLFSMLCSPSPDAVLDAGIGIVRANFDRTQRPGHDPSCITLSYINRAVCSVRETIGHLMHHCEGTQADSRAQLMDSTITAMILLALWSDAINDRNAHTVHRQGLIALINARGGVDKIDCCDGHVRCTLLKMDAIWVLNGETTMFPSHRPGYRPIYPSVPFSRDFLSRVATLPSGFQAMVHICMLPLDLIEVLARTAAAQVHYNTYGMVGDPSDLFNPRHRRFNDYWEACACFNAPDEMLYPFSKSGETISVVFPNLHKLIVLGLILYCHNTFSPATTAFYLAYRTSLTRDLPRRYAATKERRSSRVRYIDEKKWEENVLLWISQVVIDSWRGEDGTLFEPGAELLKTFKEQYSEIVNWTGVEQRLKSFFYNQGFLTRCANYWGASQ